MKNKVKRWSLGEEIVSYLDAEILAFSFFLSILTQNAIYVQYNFRNLKLKLLYRAENL